MHKYEYLIPRNHLVNLIKSLTLNLQNLPIFSDYKQNTNEIREIFVCTHASRDYCCGTFGIQLYSTIKKFLNEYNHAKIRVWRTSHLGGHRFAPTLLDMPEGRYWAYLEKSMIENFLFRNQPFADVRSYHRGLARFDVYAQILEREILLHEGWQWINYTKSAITLSNTENHNVIVKIDYRKDDNNFHGTYECIIEPDETVIDIGETYCGKQKSIKNYNVLNFKHIERTD